MILALTGRLATYRAAAAHLALLSEHQLSELLKQARPVGGGIGGAIAILEIDGTQIFIKKVRLTDIERRPENNMSTANLFELPLYYQYGISSAGFGAWRELSAYIMTTHWVLTGECLNFPLMYHWRVLPSSVGQSPLTPEESNEIERSVKYWGGSPAIRARLVAKHKASADIVLFLEYIPTTLDKWLGNQIIKNSHTAHAAITMVEHDLLGVTSFMRAQGLLHFDAHFENILTDGERLYFTDFGLAIHSGFELSDAEFTFFEGHRNYDRCLVMMSFVSRLLAALFETKKRNIILQEYAAGKSTAILPPAVTAMVSRYAPIAVLMKKFNQQLVTETKMTPYPAIELAQACVRAGLD